MFLLLLIKVIKPGYKTSCEYGMNTKKPPHQRAQCQQKEEHKASNTRDADGEGKSQLNLPLCHTNTPFLGKGKTHPAPGHIPALNAMWTVGGGEPKPPPSTYTSAFCRSSTLPHPLTSRVLLFCPLAITKQRM